MKRSRSSPSRAGSCARATRFFVGYDEPESGQAKRARPEEPGTGHRVERHDRLCRRLVATDAGGCTLTRPGIHEEPGRGGVTAATLDSKSSAREGVRVQLPPPVPFLDNVPRPPVG